MAVCGAAFVSKAKAQTQSVSTGDITAQKIPRWRGFNLSGQFSSGATASGHADDEFFATIAEWGFDFVRLPCPIGSGAARPTGGKSTKRHSPISTALSSGDESTAFSSISTCTASPAIASISANSNRQTYSPARACNAMARLLPSPTTGAC
jgi:hypothetical protein